MRGRLHLGAKAPPLLLALWAQGHDLLSGVLYLLAGWWAMLGRGCVCGGLGSRECILGGEGWLVGWLVGLDWTGLDWRLLGCISHLAFGFWMLLLGPGWMAWVLGG